MDDAERGYLAGIIDGEGCLSMREYKRKHSAPGYRVEVRVNNADKDIIDRLHAAFGGTVEPMKNYVNRPLYTWRVGSKKDVWNVLVAIYPLLCERRQAKARKIGRYITENPSRANPPREIMLRNVRHLHSPLSQSA